MKIRRFKRITVYDIKPNVWVYVDEFGEWIKLPF